MRNGVPQCRRRECAKQLVWALAPAIVSGFVCLKLSVLSEGDGWGGGVYKAVNHSVHGAQFHVLSLSNECW